MHNYMDFLALNAKKLVKKGYYKIRKYNNFRKISLKEKISSASKVNPIIAELKKASPSTGLIREEFEPLKIARSMIKGGCIGLSVITEPNYFKGNLKTITLLKKEFNIPILFKDIVVSPIQIEAAKKLGADVVLLIKKIFDMKHYPGSLSEAIDLAHAYNLEVLLENHTFTEFRISLLSEADLIGVNNRDFNSLKTDIQTTLKILSKVETISKIVISESGINKLEDIEQLKRVGVRAFLVGTAIMKAKNIYQKVRRLTGCQ
ncbi:MAG: indole-3-glycerol phosphate synthase TrpC [Candidatus Odinarchaeia archaeon]